MLCKKVLICVYKNVLRINIQHNQYILRHLMCDSIFIGIFLESKKKVLTFAVSENCLLLGVGRLVNKININRIRKALQR